MGGLTFGQDEDGNWGYKIGGADTVIPFSSFNTIEGKFIIDFPIQGDGFSFYIDKPKNRNFKSLKIQFDKAQTWNNPLIRIKEIINDEEVDKQVYWRNHDIGTEAETLNIDNMATAIIINASAYGGDTINLLTLNYSIT